MIAASAEFARRVAHGGPISVEITSWLGSTRLATIPVVPGTWQVTDNDDERVPGMVRFDVAASPEWRPTAPDHPLASFGQQIHVRIGYGTELLPVGWFQLGEPQITDEVIQCTATGLLELIRQARFLDPFAVGGVTRKWTIGKLTQGLLPVQYDTALVDELVESAVWDTERIDALWDIVEAWPARMYLDGRTLVIATPWDDFAAATPVVTIHDGPGGTLRDVDPTRAADNAHNGYRVTRVPPVATQEEMSESWVMPDGPMAWGGPYGMRTGYYSSPLLRQTRQALLDVAQVLTRRSVRRRDALDFQAGPDYRLQRGDVIRLVSARDSIDMVGRITSISHTRTSTSGTIAYLSGVR